MLLWSCWATAGTDPDVCGLTLSLDLSPVSSQCTCLGMWAPGWYGYGSCLWTCPASLAEVLWGWALAGEAGSVCSAPSLLSLGDSLASAVPRCLLLCSFSVFLSTLSYYAVLSDFPYALSVSLLRFSGPFSLQVSSWLLVCPSFHTLLLRSSLGLLAVDLASFSNPSIPFQ